MLVFGFVPRFSEVYQGVSGRGLLYPLLFGFLWGISQTTFGLGLKALGIAFAVVAGLCALFGSLVPLLVLNPSDLLRPRGLLLLASIPILLLGLAFYAFAGRRREQEQPQSGASEPTGSFATGLAICIFTGIVGPSWNLGFAFSGELVRRSLELGASTMTSTYAVWGLVLAAGLVPNLLYCAYRLVRDGSWRLFAATRWPREAALAVAMALLWLSGIVVYGIGTSVVGRYGTSVGFALFVSAQILTSNTLGVLAGEWKATSARTRQWLAAALLAIIASVVVLSLGGLF
jgi:L-rhamnose-H+ transport protein